MEALYSLTIVYQDAFGRISQFVTFKKDQDLLINLGFRMKNQIINSGSVFLYSLVESVSETDFAPEVDYQTEVTNH